jgi:3-phenylpropionate/cinnamic acid dioxygenase small subunit
MDGVSQDELAIRRLLERYMRHNDDKSLDRILALFTPDAVYRVGGGEHIGHDAIRAYLARVGFRDGQPRWTDDDQLMVMPRSMHLMTNPIIDVEGDEATAESEFVVMVRDGDGRPKMILVGRYRDRLRRDAGAGWLFAERTGVSLARETDPPGRREPSPWADSSSGPARPEAG